MKVLHIIDSGGLYGAESMLLNLAEGQVKLGLEPVIASIGEKGVAEKPLEAEAVRRGIAVRKFRMVPGPNLAGAIKILNYARSGGFDLLHSHGYKGNILFGLMPRALRKLPMVSTLHGYTYIGGFSRMGVYEWLDSLSLRFADAVVLVDQTMRSHPKLKKFNGFNFHVINNGIPVSSSSPEHSFHCSTIHPFDHLSKNIIGFCSCGFTICAVGRLSPEKGFDLLLDAVAALVAAGRDLRLVIMGEGGLRRELESQAGALGLRERLLMPGYVPNARTFLSRMGLLAMPSLTEGLPMVLLEAMAEGVPIVASRVGGIPEMLGNGRAGILVPPLDVGALREAIRAVMDDPAAARQRAAAALEHASTAYSSRAMAESYSDLYRQVAPPRPRMQNHVTR